MHVNAEIIFYGGTDPNATVWVDGKEIKLNPDGTFTVFFGSRELCGDVPNRIDTPEGWNFMMRVYRPDRSVLNGGYKLPPVELLAAPKAVPML